jgi:hypothetical protein
MGMSLNPAMLVKHHLFSGSRLHEVATLITLPAHSIVHHGMVSAIPYLTLPSLSRQLGC